MRLSYRTIRRLDAVASVLRALRLHRLTRLGRNLLGRCLTQGIAVEAEGQRLVGSVRDRAFLYKVKEGHFEPETIRVFCRAVRPGMVVLDAGAYLGYYSLLAARQVGPRGKVYAFEPDPASFSFLERNIRLNGYANVVAIAKAIASTTGVRSFHRHPCDPSMHSLVPRKGSRTSISVPCTSVDEFLGEQRVDVVKIDIEGAEPLALQGMMKTLERSPALSLFLELNRTSLSEAGKSPDQLISQIRSLGLDSITRLDEQRNLQGKLELCNLYCRRGGSAC